MARSVNDRPARAAGPRPVPRLARRLLVAALLFAAPPAHATWSIVAVDPDTREVGVAAASCIAGVDVVVGLAPGRAAVAAQAFSSAAGKAHLLERLVAGHAPDVALASVATPEFDAAVGFPLYRLRQYGVAALPPSGGVASYTGAWTFARAGARGGPFVGVQGNLLRDDAVLDGALAAYAERGPAECPRPFAERLLVALEAGAAAGGDRRCSAELAALSAVLAVAAAGDAPEAPSLRLRAVTPGYDAPSPAGDLRRLLGSPEPGIRDDGAVPRLRASYETWLVAHPHFPRCAAPARLESAPRPGPAE